ncbi:MAG TPA: superoxide dismutase family protein [Anaeromyxobacteraceae bacterium]|nr:superoxide dismutase family protein [Anaeromyxobacteraceae bacterium]
MRLAALLALAFPLAGAAAPTARAELKDAKGRGVGMATLEETGGGVRITLDARNLPPGPHAFHVHETGRCDPPDFKTAGAHFNPDKREHGTANPKGPHAGDLPNLTVKPDGTATATGIARGATLGEGPRSLLKAGGTALVVHEKADDDRTDPAGNAGGRIACGLVTRSGQQ